MTSNVLKRMQNQFSDFSFKLKITYIFHSFQHIPHLSCKFENFKKKLKKSRGWIFFIGLVDPSRIRLVSTAYFASLFSILQAWGCIHQNRNFFRFRSGQIYMKNAEYAESKEKSYFRFIFFELWSFFTQNMVNFR